MIRNTATIDIQTQYNQGERDFPKLQLRRIDLRNNKLRGINLAGSDLSYADLRDVDLTNANLSNCYLNEANLSGANLSGANLKGAYLIKAYLTRVSFKKAILKETYLTGSFLTKADLSQADLCGAFLNGAHLNGANFREAVYDNSTRFDKSFEPNSLGMKISSSFQQTAARKVSIGDITSNFESIASITSHYLGGTITAKNFEDSRPDVEWLQQFCMDKKGKISFTGTMSNQATMMQLKWFEKWTNAFIKKSSIIIQDLPNIIEEKHLTVEYLIKNNVA
ncbi:pentapeptide repeat family protein [Geminocystis sp. NIES-3708]|uniref:pentapeptide repeat-containing protein n=1 Tax=Geminocystis sp. NIES-3708 TaxID=1615909 RepID=UPI0005FC4484|nr:pentapeptide repeat-containing protein [Geminocystis sp. NIES-3708]BAQ60530.1 pentapeptide repeat family protein [Geminocystis sp. NIES-3708]